MKHLKTINEFFGMFGSKTNPDDKIGEKIVQMMSSEKCEIQQEIKYKQIHFYVLFEVEEDRDIAVVVLLSHDPIIYWIENDEKKKLMLGKPLAKQIYDLVWRQYYKQRREKIAKMKPAN